MTDLTTRAATLADRYAVNRWDATAATIRDLLTELASVTSQRDSLLRQHAKQDIARFAPSIGAATVRDRCIEAGIDLAEGEAVTGLQLRRNAG